MDKFEPQFEDLDDRTLQLVDENTLENLAPVNSAATSSGKRESPKKCVVPFCHFVATQGFSVFPKDLIRKKAWLEAFGLTDAKSDARVCHGHFSESYFSAPKSTTLGKRRRLKFDAIPDLNLPASKIPKLDHVHKITEVAFNYNECDISQAVPQPDVPLEFRDNDHDYPGSSYMSEALSHMDSVITHLRNENKKLRRDLQIANKKLLAYQAGKLPQTEVKKIVHKALEHSVLSKGQINWHLSKKKRKRSNEWVNIDWAKVRILLFLAFFKLLKSYWFYIISLLDLRLFLVQNHSKSICIYKSIFFC